MTAADIDKIGRCATCRREIEHYAGVPGSKYMTPFWRHVKAPGTHPAVLDPDTVQEVPR